MRESWFTDGGYRSIAMCYYPWAANFEITDESGDTVARLDVYTEWLGENGHMKVSAVHVTNMQRMRPLFSSLMEIKGVPVEDRERLLSRMRKSASRFFPTKS